MKKTDKIIKNRQKWPSNRQKMAIKSSKIKIFKKGLHAKKGKGSHHVSLFSPGSMDYVPF